MPRVIAINRYSELTNLYPFRRRIRNAARNTAILLLSRFCKANSSKEWIRFPFYHHVFDDEQKDFERHLCYYKQYGDFISLNDAIGIFDKKEKIGGRYFCLSFDDGFKNIIDNALPMLLKHKCRAAVFIPTEYIGCDIQKEGKKVEGFFMPSRDAYPRPIEFLDWDDCRKLHREGMIIGSHTNRHVPLSGLKNEELRQELLVSKQKIEKELEYNCLHFSCPWGHPGKHFTIDSDLIFAKEMGYYSFLTALRGPNFNGADPFAVKRDHVIAKWGNYQLNFFLSK